MEYVAAFVIYAIVVFVLKEFFNAKSLQNIKKEVFESYNQIFFFAGIVFFFIYNYIHDTTTFAISMKYGMLVLIGIDILIYLNIKFRDYPFGWAILSIILDILAFPIGLVFVLGIFAFLASLMDRGSCYYDCD